MKFSLFTFLLLVASPALADSNWEHNGSTMQLSTQGKQRTITYMEPRASLPVRPGAVLFRGYIEDDGYQGEAFSFSAKCGPIGFAVQGPATNQLIQLTGKKPRRDKNCKVVDYEPEHLVFTRLGQTAADESEQEPIIEEGGVETEETAEGDSQNGAASPAEETESLAEEPSEITADRVRVGVSNAYDAPDPLDLDRYSSHSDRFDAAIAKQLCKSIGKPCELVGGGGSEDQLIDKFVDIIVYQLESPDDIQVAVTKEYARIPLAFVVRKDSQLGEISSVALKGKTIVVGDLDGKSFAVTRLRQSKVLDSTTEDFLKFLAEGQADVAVAKLDAVHRQITGDLITGQLQPESPEKVWGECCKIIQVFLIDSSPRPGPRMLVRSSDKALKSLVEKTIDEMERSGKIREAGIAIFGFDVSPNAKLGSSSFPIAAETSEEIEPAIAERSVMLTLKGEGRCSGVLLNATAVLSAAHCFTDKGRTNIRPNQIRLYQNGNKLARKAERIINHPEYAWGVDKKRGDINLNDITILILTEDGTAMQQINILKGNEGFLSDYSRLYFDGAQYGFGNPDANDARLVKTRVRAHLDVTPPNFYFMGETELIESKATDGLCSGDSGSGVFLAPGGFVGADERPLLLGILSYGGNKKPTDRCGIIAGIMRADVYSEWIAATLKKYGSQ